MNWDAIGAIGEVIGALAVVASLIYLASQVRHNNRLARNDSLQTVLQSEMNFASIIIREAEIWDRLIAGETFTDKEDNRKATILYNLYILDSANRYYQHSSGYLRDAAWEGRKRTLHQLVNWPMFETWRHSLGASGHSKEFLEVIDQIKAEEIQKSEEKS